MKTNITNHELTLDKRWNGEPVALVSWTEKTPQGQNATTTVHIPLEVFEKVTAEFPKARKRACL